MADENELPLEGEGIEADDINAALTAAFEAAAPPEASEDTPPEPEGEPEPQTPPPADPSPQPEPEPLQSDRLNVLGRDFKTDEVQALVDFYDWLRANPADAMKVDAYMRGQAQFVTEQQQAPAQQAPEPQEDPFEDVDPAIKAKLAEIDELRQSVSWVEQDRAQQRAAAANLAVERGSKNFQEKFGLADEQMVELQNEAAALGVLPTLAQQRGDMMVAVEESLEMAYWKNPTFREAELQRQIAQQNTDKQRQRKASAVSGGSGSMPRGQKEYDLTTAEGRKAAMVNDLTEAMNQ